MSPKSGTLSSAYNWKIIWSAAVLLLSVVGGFVFYSKTSSATQAANESGLQTERVRRGDLTVTASGSGTLVAQTDATFGFEASGQVTDVFVKVGDAVEAGQVLAQLDDTLAQIDYIEAEQALLELYSAASIAAVQQEIGTAQDTEYYAREWLEYLISEEVVEAEENLAMAQAKLEEAQTEAKAHPSDAAEQTVKEKEQAVTFLQGKLDQAWTYYNNVYLPENFGEYENIGSRRFPKMILVTMIDPITGEEVPEINGPSIADIATARNNLAQARETIKEDEIYLEVLQTGLIPEDATGEKLTALYEAQQAVEAAKSALQDTQLIAPVSGTVTSIKLSIGEQIDKDNSSVITISQLSQPYMLDVYLEEADWDKAQIGNKVNISFDLLDGQTFPGTVTLVYPVLSESWESSLVHITVQLDQRISQDLPAGTGADVEVVGGEARDVALVSVDALHKTDDGRTVLTVIQNGEQMEREVEIGLQNDTYAEVKSGLEAGEIVVTR